MVLLREWLLVKAAEQEEEVPAATADDMMRLWSVESERDVIH